MTEIDLLPDSPGSYALVGKLYQAVELEVGRFGSFVFPAGVWVYCGSAWGPGGLRARIGHHARIQAAPRWHLDWLRPHLVLRDLYLSPGAHSECIWSFELSMHPFASVPVPGFGACDCRSGCPAHLIRLDEVKSISSLQGLLKPESTCQVSHFHLH